MWGWVLRRDSYVFGSIWLPVILFAEVSGFSGFRVCGARILGRSWRGFFSFLAEWLACEYLCWCAAREFRIFRGFQIQGDEPWRVGFEGFSGLRFSCFEDSQYTEIPGVCESVMCSCSSGGFEV